MMAKLSVLRKAWVLKVNKHQVDKYSMMVIVLGEVDFTIKLIKME